MKNTLIILLLLLSLLSSSVLAEKGEIGVKGLVPIDPEIQDVIPVDPHLLPRALPVYLSELSNLNDYSVFANGGWDGNWYVGFNACWMEEIPQPPEGEYDKVFVGAKLGRAKTRRVPGRPIWEKEAIPGLIYIAVSSTPAWKSNQQYFLASSEDIPLEPDAENALEGVGESRWFWAEVPKETINFDGPNYVALWSPSEYFVSVASSPIIAGGWGSKKANSWISNDTKGYPPNKPEDATKTAITVFEPAIAMKLVPAGATQELKVSVASIKEGRDKTSNKTFILEINGKNIDRAWLEISADGKKWEKIGRAAYSVPYMLTLLGDKMPEGKIKVRACVSDVWGDRAYSLPAEIVVTKTTTK